MAKSEQAVTTGNAGPYLLLRVHADEGVDCTLAYTPLTRQLLDSIREACNTFDQCRVLARDLDIQYLNNWEVTFIPDLVYGMNGEVPDDVCDTLDADNYAVVAELPPAQVKHLEQQELGLEEHCWLKISAGTAFSWEAQQHHSYALLETTILPRKDLDTLERHLGTHP